MARLRPRAQGFDASGPTPPIWRSTAARRTASEVGTDDDGFTLIELLVVLLIIGILLAIAIPTFLTVTRTANDTAAQANLKSAMITAKSYLIASNGGNGSYTNLASNWNTLGPGFVGTTLNSSGPTVVSISSTATEVVLAVYATATNRCWGIVDDMASDGELGQTTPAMVYFGVKPATGAAGCLASTYQAATAAVSGVSASVTGFPDTSTF